MIKIFHKLRGKKYEELVKMKPSLSRSSPTAVQRWGRWCYTKQTACVSHLSKMVKALRLVGFYVWRNYLCPDLQYLCYFGLFFSFGPICIGAIISPFGYAEAQLILQIWSHKIHFLTLERFVANYSPRFLISIPPWWLSAEIQGHSYFPQRERWAKWCRASTTLFLLPRGILFLILSLFILLARSKQETNKNHTGTKIYISWGRGKALIH